MGEIFLKLLNMSITAGWLILAVLCVRLLFRKMPKWVNCLLWGVVAVRLIFPFSIESALSLQPSAEPIQSSTVVSGEILPYVPSVDSDLPVVENTVNPILAETFAYSETESVAPLQVFTEVAGIVWVVGMITLLAFAVGSMIRLSLLVKESVRYKNNVYICDRVKSPFILGIIRPRVYLSSSLTREEIEYIMAHEKAHLKRKDHLWKPFGYLLLSIYWFNPLCWVAYIMLCKDIELACDEKVIKDMNFEDKKEYSRVLLSCATQRRLVMACPLAFGEVGVKERVKTVLNYKKPAFWITIAAIAVCAVLAICFLTNPQKEYQIRITIPAGSTETFCYSDEEISPNGNTLVLANGDGLGDTEVLLLPIEVKEENSYDTYGPTYMTSGMPVKMDVEKGAWFKIGVNMQNPTSEDIHVYVSVSDVEVRIADSDSIVEPGDESSSETSERVTEEINVEKSDVTHDGVVDYIVTSMSYYASDVDANSSLKERIEQQIMYDVVNVKVYEGQKDSETYNEENLLWSQEYSRVHVGNGQLSIVQIDGKDYMLTSNLYDTQGIATWECEVFSLNGTGEKEVIDKQAVEFGMEGEDATESSKEFQSLIDKYINNGILIVACDINFQEQLIRTPANPCVPQDYYNYALSKYSSEDISEELEQEGLEEKTVAGAAMADTSAIASIVVTNGNTGEQITLTGEDTYSQEYYNYHDLLKLYTQLDFTAEYEENTRVGYQYCMKLQDADGNKLQMVTPYKDGLTVDRVFYQYGDTGNGADASLRLMEYLEYIFYLEESSMAMPFAEVPVNTLPNVTMIMVNYKKSEGDIEIVNGTFI